MSTLRPTGARIDPATGHLLVPWTDGVTLRYPIDALRAACPCAGCVDEWTGKVLVSIEMFPGVTLKSLKQVGQYAFNVVFSDGHDTGLYTWSKLREIGRNDGDAAPPT
jgi:DUF971 family protein